MSSPEQELENLISATNQTIRDIESKLLPMSSAQFYCLVAEFDTSITDGTRLLNATYTSTAVTISTSGTSGESNTAAFGLKVLSPGFDFLAIKMTGLVSGGGTTGAPLMFDTTNVAPNELYRLQVYDTWRNRNWFPVPALGAVIFGGSRRPYVFPKGFVIPAGTTLKFTITNLSGPNNGVGGGVNDTGEDIHLAQFMIAGYLLPKSSHRFRE